MENKALNTIETLILNETSKGRKLEMFVLPSVSTTKIDLNQATTLDNRNVVVGYFDKHNKVKVLHLSKEQIESLDITSPVDIFTAGRRLTFTSKGTEIFLSYGSKRTSVWKRATVYKGAPLCYGQNILLSAPAGGGKTSTLIEVCNLIENSSVNGTSYRILFGERSGDSLYSIGTENKSIYCDAVESLVTQLNTVYETLTKALKDAYDGKDVVFALDSATRFVTQLSGAHSDLHMVSGGLSSDVNKMASNLLRLGGSYGKGTLTVVTTCLYANSNNTWKAIYTELSAAADAEILCAKVRGVQKIKASSRRDEIMAKAILSIGNFAFEL